MEAVEAPVAYEAATSILLLTFSLTRRPLERVFHPRFEPALAAFDQSRRGL